jgi:hypothetical protein
MKAVIFVGNTELLEISEGTQSRKCLNCDKAIGPDASFCKYCGQKTRGVSLDFKTLISDLWTSIFNLDNTFFRSLKMMWAPWKLTRYYVEGKRKSFLNPVRLFLICLLLHFGVLTSIATFDNRFLGTGNEYTKLERSKLFEKHIHLLNNYDRANTEVCDYADTLNKVLFGNTDVLHNQKLNFLENTTFYNKKYDITLQDAIELQPEQLFKKYNITEWWEKLLIKQVIRFNLDKAGALKYAMQNIAWGVIPVVFLLALIFKLMYIRQKRYYAEHLVFLMNVHSVSFLLVTVFIPLTALIQGNVDLPGYLFLSVMALFYISMYKYYGQGFLKTFAKYIIAGFSYLLLVLIFLLIAGLISLVLY